METSEQPKPAASITVRLPRLSKIPLWLAWISLLLILLDFVGTSNATHNPQATIMACGFFAIILVAGLVVIFIQRIEAKEREKHIDRDQLQQ